MIDTFAANSRIGVQSEYIEKAIDRQPQNHSPQNQDKYQLIGTEVFHHIGLVFMAWSRAHGAEHKMPQTEY